MTNIVQAHGMGTDPTEPTWPAIAAADIQQLLAFYPDLHQAGDILWHSPRPFSSAAIVVIDGQKRFVKRHSSNIRDVEGLKEEHGFLQHLAQHDVPVSAVLSGTEGETAFSIGEWNYEIHELGQGVDLYRDAISWSPFQSDEHAFAAGRIMAQMHLASETYEKPERKVQPLVSCFDIWNTDDPIAATKQFTVGRPGLEAYLRNREWEQDFERVLFPFYQAFEPYRDLQPLWAHNDLHASNLLWTSDSDTAEVAMIIDFGLSNRTSAVYDLATALERNTVEWLKIGETVPSIAHTDKACALLKGYESVRPLSSHEKEALLAIMPLVHTDFALSEVDYFMRITGDLADADLAYDAFLLGHADWFNTDDGLNYLKQLKTCMIND